MRILRVFSFLLKSVQNPKRSKVVLFNLHHFKDRVCFIGVKRPSGDSKKENVDFNRNQINMPNADNNDIMIITEQLY